MTAPTLDDVRAIFRRHIEDMEKWQAQDIAAGHTTSSWEEGLSIYRLALAALDDAERYHALRKAACAALGRHKEVVESGSFEQAMGWAEPRSDWAVAQRALLDAAHVVAVGADGFVDFVDAARREGA